VLGVLVGGGGGGWGGGGGGGVGVGGGGGRAKVHGVYEYGGRIACWVSFLQDVYL